jgi:hypothetical protein
LGLSYKTNTGYYREYAFDAYGYNSNRQISTYRIVSDNLDSDIAFTYDNMLRVSGETLTWGDRVELIPKSQKREPCGFVSQGSLFCNSFF